jgi:baseplate J-like protein
MALARPILDDRSYEQLRDELVRRIPVYNREWTDHNPVDPGITLLELFAFLGENLLYRFNQIPETTKLEFLDLLDLPLRPAEPARAMVELSTEVVRQPDGTAGALVEAETELRAGSVPFELRTETHVLPVKAIAVAKTATALPDADSEPEVFGFFLSTVDALGGLDSTEEAAAYRADRVPAEAGLPPVDFDTTVDGVLWVAVVAAVAGDPADLRRDLFESHGGPPLLNFGFVPDLAAPPADEAEPCPGEGAPSPVRPVEWQISAGELDAEGDPVYRALRVEADSTAGLSREGVVRLLLPAKGDLAGPFVLPDAEQAGTGALPPPLDEETEPKVLFWLRAFRPDGSRFGKVQWVGANAGLAEQTKTARPEFLGTGDAQPGQEMALVHRPVIAGSLVLEVEGPDGWVRWQEVDGFHASKEDDPHFVLDSEAGRVRFGNGLQGRAPQLGERVRARSYRYGGGRAGNVAAKAIAKLIPKSPALPPVKVANPLPAWGGADKEELAAALERIPGELRRRDRAVTRGDFRELALATPGGAVGRAECLPLFHPPSRIRDAAGVVTVVVWPREDPAHPNAPLPDRRLLESVCRFLDARRLVTTELYVVPPTYRKVAVAVGLRAKPGYGVEAVRRWVELVLRQYLAPLPPFGPEGAGWPLGRRVHGPELEAAALQVEGVEYLENLRVAGWNPATGSWDEGTVELALDEVPELAEITVVEGPPLDPGATLGPIQPEKTPVPVPVVREEC